MEKEEKENQSGDKIQDFCKKHNIMPTDILVDQDSFIGVSESIRNNFRYDDSNKLFSSFLSDFLDTCCLMEAVALGRNILIADTDNYVRDELRKSETGYNLIETGIVKFLPREDLRGVCYRKMIDRFILSYQEITQKDLTLEEAKRLAMQLHEYSKLNDDERADFNDASTNPFIRLEEAIGHPSRHVIARFSRILHLIVHAKSPDELPDDRWCRPLFDQALANQTIADNLNVTYLPGSFTAPLATQLNMNQGRLLYKSYKSFSGSFFNEIIELEKLGLPSIVEIPPIPLLALSRSSRPDEIFDKVTELRSEFSSLRDRIDKLTCLASDSTHSLGEIIDMRKDILDELDQYVDSMKFDGRSSRFLYEALHGTVKGSLGDELNVNLSLNSLIDLARRGWKVGKVRRHAKGFLSLKDEIRKVSGYHSHVERVFKNDITSSDVEVFQSFTNHASKKWFEQVVKDQTS